VTRGEAEGLAVWLTWAPEVFAQLGWRGDPYIQDFELIGESGQQVRPIIVGVTDEWYSFVQGTGLRYRFVGLVGPNRQRHELLQQTPQGWQLVKAHEDRPSNFTSFDRAFEVAFPAVIGSVLTAGVASAFAPALTAAGVPAGAVPGASRVAAGATMSLVQTGKVNPEALARTAAMQAFQALGPGAGAARGVTTMGDDWGILNADTGAGEGIIMDQATDFDGQPIFPAQDIYGTPDTEDRGWTPERAAEDTYGTPATEERGYIPSPYPPYSTTPTTPPALPPITPPQPPAPASSDWSFDTLQRQVTGAALSAISVIRAWESRKLPVNTTARSTDAQGNIVLARSDGLLYTRSATGQVTAARPPVGLPQTTVDGYIVVNNGDGTFSKVSPTGSTTQERYGTMPAPAAGGVPMSGLAGMNQATMLYLAGAAALFLVLRK